MHIRPHRRTMWFLLLAGLAAIGLFAFVSRLKKFPDLHLTSEERREWAARASGMTIKPREGVGNLRFGMTPDEVIAMLGNPDERGEIPSHNQTTLHYRRLGLHLTFDTGGAELRAILCLSDSQETLFSRENKPAITFAGSTSEGIRIGSTYRDVVEAYGPPDRSEQYFPERRGQPAQPEDVVEHAFLDSLMVLEKGGRVVELHVVLPRSRRAAPGTTRE